MFIVFKTDYFQLWFLYNIFQIIGQINGTYVNRELPALLVGLLEITRG